MSQQNPYDYIDQTTINGNRYDNKYNRFGKNEQPLYVLNHTSQKQEIHEVDVNDLVNDAILDRLMNVTEDGVRRRDNYILNEPIDLKTSGNKTIIYRDRKISNADKYSEEHERNGYGKPRSKHQTTAEFNRELRELEILEDLTKNVDNHVNRHKVSRQLLDDIIRKSVANPHRPFSSSSSNVIGVEQNTKERPRNFHKRRGKVIFDNLNNNTSQEYFAPPNYRRTNQQILTDELENMHITKKSKKRKN